MAEGRLELIGLEEDLLHRFGVVDLSDGLLEIGAERPKHRHFDAELAEIAQQDHELGLVETAHYRLGARCLDLQGLRGRVRRAALEGGVHDDLAAVLLDDGARGLAVAVRPVVAVLYECNFLDARLAHGEGRHGLARGDAGVSNVEHARRHRVGDLGIG